VFILSLIVTLVLGFGYFIVKPNMSRVLVLFGTYRGTVRTEGFHWTNPFTNKGSISLRAHNLSTERIKVNDLLGNPIEIGAVVVWQVRDTAQAKFDVEDYYQYVDLQCETAVRQLAKSHPYDDRMGETEAPSLRTDTEQISEGLTVELQERLDRAGIEVLEARISHLAYAPEIASAMLQRQQADAIIAARRKIVEGAVGMVDDALTQLGDRGVVDLDPERRATLVGNLLVVLCGHATPQPVLNAGTLYN
jgi:regulator of protease activity HflC (stomatin/prohibitin superfamily)